MPGGGMPALSGAPQRRTRRIPIGITTPRRRGGCPPPVSRRLESLRQATLSSKKKFFPTSGVSVWGSVNRWGRHGAVELGLRCSYRGVTRMVEHGTDRIKRGLAEMLKGGVIMDVTSAEQAAIAEEAGAVAVMALERHDGDGAGLLCNGGLLGRGDVHDDTPLQHLGKAALDPVSSVLDHAGHSSVGTAKTQFYRPVPAPPVHRTPYRDPRSGEKLLLARKGCLA